MLTYLVVFKAGAETREVQKPDAKRSLMKVPSFKEIFPVLALTMGDPNGIGAEVMLRALDHLSPIKAWQPLIFGDLQVLEEVRKRLQLDLVFSRIDLDEWSKSRKDQNSRIPVLDLGQQSLNDWEPGTCSSWGGDSAFRFLNKAIQWTLEGRIDAIVTAPLNKEALKKAGHDFPGHTDILAEVTGRSRAWMMLECAGLRSVMVTLHISLREVLEQISRPMILETIEVAHQALLQMGLEYPRIGVAGLNPHAGENGLFGDEERLQITPAIEDALQKGIQASGPFSPDTIFLRHRSGEFDVVVAMYHDQALVPLKLMGFGKSVNITLGLPLIRTSVDHGTAFDRAASFNSDPSSMEAAIKAAIRLYGSSTVVADPD